MNWEPTPTGYRCKRPGHVGPDGEPVEWDRGKDTCHFCATDPGEGPTADNGASEAIDNAIIAESNEFKTHARRLWREASELLDGTDLEKNIAVKCSAEATKWERLALEAKDRVAQRKHLRETMAHERAMAPKRKRGAK